MWVEGKLDRADPEKGRFRSYLHGALRRFRARKFRDLYAPGAVQGSTLPQDLPAEAEDRTYDQAYAALVMLHAEERLERLAQDEVEQEGSSVSLVFILIRDDVFPPRPERQTSHAELAARYGVTLKVIEHSFANGRKRLHECFRQEIIDTLQHPTIEEVAAEYSWVLKQLT